MKSNALLETAQETRPLSVYVAVGPQFINFTVDVETGELTRQADLRLPSRMQYAWPHPTLPIIYAGCADRSPEGQTFQLCALWRDEAGNLSFLGEPVTLPARPIHLTLDSKGRHILTAFNAAPGLALHRLNDDGSIGGEIPRAEPFDMGVSPHQIRVTPGDERAILVARGTKGFGTPVHKQGSFKVMRFDQGQLENLYTIAPGTELSPGGFNPRHLDFHPTLPLLYVSLEEQNELMVLRLNEGDVDPVPLHRISTLVHPENVQPRQDCGAVHIHPNGRFVYVANRNDGYIGDQGGRPTWITPSTIPVFPGGENSIAVFSLSDKGEPKLEQIINSGGLHPRTFTLDPEGKLLIVGNLAPTIFKEGDKLVDVPANLSVFRIAADGTLTFVRRYDIDVGSEMVWWIGAIA